MLCFASQLPQHHSTHGKSHGQNANSPPRFPHAPATLPPHHHGRANVLQHMASPPSRLSDTDALKKTHLSLLSAVMHRCLLDGDYDRAGRAWGIILRTHVAGGHPVDARNHGRWGIGAEVLLRQSPPANQAEQSHQASRPAESHVFSDHGFDLAGEYYERMIVQHPNRRTQPHAVDEKSFYPAMFSLCIFQVAEKSKRARKSATDEAALWFRSSRSTSLDSVRGAPEADSRAKQDVLQARELAQATDIADRLDQLMASPPFDKEAGLLQLRGNVALWISNLVLGDTTHDADWDMDSVITDSEDNAEFAAEQLIRLNNCQRELQQAQRFFQQAAANGANGQAALMSSIDIRLRELTQQVQRLN